MAKGINLRGGCSMVNLGIRPLAMLPNIGFASKSSFKSVSIRVHPWLKKHLSSAFLQIQGFRNGCSNRLYPKRDVEPVLDIEFALKQREFAFR